MLCPGLTLCCSRCARGWLWCCLCVVCVFVRNLSGNELVGGLPRSLGQLTALSSLCVGRGRGDVSCAGFGRVCRCFVYFYSMFPVAVGVVVAARCVSWLNDNALSGSLPESLGQLTALREL